MADTVGLGGIEVVADVGDGYVFHIDIFASETFILGVIYDTANVNAPHQAAKFQLHGGISREVSIPRTHHRNPVEVKVIRRPYDGTRHVVLVGKLAERLSGKELRRIFVQIGHGNDAHTLSDFLLDLELGGTAGVWRYAYVIVILDGCPVKNVKVQPLDAVCERDIGRVAGLGLGSGSANQQRHCMLFVSCGFVLRW